MANIQHEILVTFEAAADLSSDQFHFVTINSDGQAALASDGGRVDGVLANDPSLAGRAASVAIGGITRVKVGSGGVTAGDDLASDSNSEAATASSGEAIVGTALETGAAGAVVSMLFQPRGNL